MKKFLFVLFEIIISLDCLAQFQGYYTSSDNTYSFCADINYMNEWEIKEYGSEYIRKFSNSSLNEDEWHNVLLYTINQDRSYKNLIDAPTLIISPISYSDSVTYMDKTGNREYYIINTLNFHIINTSPRNIRKLVINVEYYDCNNELLYDLKTGKSFEQFIITNIQGRGTPTTMEEMYKRVTDLFNYAIKGNECTSSFNNNRKSSFRIKNIVAHYNNKVETTKFHEIDGAVNEIFKWGNMIHFDVEKFLDNSPFAPIYNYLKLKNSDV